MKQLIKKLFGWLRKAEVTYPFEYDDQMEAYNARRIFEYEKRNSTDL